MIHCVPRGICSWNFILGGDGHAAETQINWMGEQGSLRVDGTFHEVRKLGWLSGEWELVDGSSVILHARKPRAFTRTFELTGPHEQSILSAPSAFGRTMQLVGSDVDCVISPAHLFTRRATIEGNIGDFRTVSFAFWLTVLTWRRSANNNNSGGGAS
jgi:hypothetical protein